MYEECFSSFLLVLLQHGTFPVFQCLILTTSSAVQCGRLFNQFKMGYFISLTVSKAHTTITTTATTTTYTLWTTSTT